ncbi:putative sporulation protein YtxC [Cytobacillus sp. FSL W7-1323]|uniref:putative sporulation protein YtxC n=1 Tax=Cytobacillus TaxID=2675230 RepID=UPI0012FE6727|nr:MULTISPECIES: putative sporulation protein YtxC [Cytobacillus]MDQ0183458.1 putative sporulation protein YtxC [Cytobacillus kochii]MEA1853362.1 putative sporulation protein YtxC [Cytobacillus sp. OWB-43]MED1603959.1 putative sporulation protein YtxC [Cytobacillus kochii]
MIEIIFRNKHEAEELFQHAIRIQNYTEGETTILHNEGQYIVRMYPEQCSGRSIEEVKRTFSAFLMESKCDSWFRKIMAEKFYYQDSEEQQQILEIIHSILEGQREDLSTFLHRVDIHEQLRSAIDRLVHDDISFSYDAFIKFRLKPLLDDMTKYVELSIDEYKMEQEYQMFIQTLRDFIKDRESKLPTIHLYLGEEVRFFNQHFEELSRMDLTAMIDRRLLINHPVYVDSVTIAPLLSIAPQEICLYSESEEQPLVRTIKNIFEERLEILHISEFNMRKQHACKNISEPS